MINLDENAMEGAEDEIVNNWIDTVRGGKFIFKCLFGFSLDQKTHLHITYLQTHKMTKIKLMYNSTSTPS